MDQTSTGIITKIKNGDNADMNDVYLRKKVTPKEMNNLDIKLQQGVDKYEAERYCLKVTKNDL